jgi:glucose/arabinose dehydrogenase
MRKLASITMLVAIVTVVAACAPPSSFDVTTTVTGLNRPWDVGFTPDGTMLFTQKSGQINALVGGAVVELAKPVDSVVSGEGGMMGLAIDSKFASNRYIYTCFLSNKSGPLDVRVVRWKVDAAYTTLSGRRDIVTGIPVRTGTQIGRHSGCRPRFGPDGYLWVGTGDAATGTNPQNPQSLGGKVLRVTRSGGGAPGNPGGAFLPQIYTYGHRNVQGIAFRPSDGKAFSIEHGTACDDEVNVLVAGANYGWDPVPSGGGPGYNEAVPMTDLTKFPDAVPAVWSSGCPTIAPSGGGFVSGIQWGSWSGSLAVAVLKDTRVMFLKLSIDGQLVERNDRITDQGRLRTAVQGPDGDLYVSQDTNPGGILRIHPVTAT